MRSEEADVEEAKHLKGQAGSYGSCTGSAGELDSQICDMHELLDVVESGWFHVFASVPLAGVMFAEGAELLITSGIAGALKQEWDLTSMQKGMLSSLAFMGLALGSMLSGLVADRAGRLAAIKASLVGMGVVGLLSALGQDFNQMMVLRLLNGAACGVGLPASWTMWSEIFPTAHRATALIWPSFCLCLGQLFASSLLIFYMPDLTFGNWRVAAGIAALPSFLLLPLVSIFVVESPHWLAVTGRGKEAREVIIQMATANGTLSQIEAILPPVLIIDHPGDEALSWGESCVLLMSSFRNVVNLLCCSLLFVVGNLLGFGMSYFWPQALREVGGIGEMSPAFCLMCVYAAGCPQIFLGYFVMQSSIGHRLMIVMLSIFTAVNLFISYYLLGTDSGFLLLSGALSAISSGVLYTCLVSMVSETFPTSVRGFAVGICLTIGRIAPICAPVLIEAVSKSDFLLIVACCALVNCILVLPLAETKQLPFEQVLVKNEASTACKRRQSTAGTGEVPDITM